MSHDTSDLFPGEMVAGTNVITCFVLFSTEVLYIIAHELLELNRLQTAVYSVIGVKTKRNIATFQFIGLQAKNMELIDMMNNPIEI